MSDVQVFGLRDCQLFCSFRARRRLLSLPNTKERETSVASYLLTLTLTLYLSSQRLETRARMYAPAERTHLAAVGFGKEG